MSIFSPTLAVVDGLKRPSQKEHSKDVLPTLEFPTRTTLNSRSGANTALSFAFWGIIKGVLIVLQTTTAASSLHVINQSELNAVNLLVGSPSQQAGLLETMKSSLLA